MIVKTRRQGNSIMVTIPASFNIGENGIISLLPVRYNIFKEDPSYDLRKAIEEDHIGDTRIPVGQEDI